MKDIFDTKVNIELTLGELESIIICLRAAHKNNTGSVRSELEKILSNLSVDVKIGQYFENANGGRKMYKSKAFLTHFRLTDFLNSNNIKKEQIIGISYDGNFFNLFYID